MKVLLWFSFMVSLVYSSSIEVVIDGIKKSDGVVQVTLFNKEKGFPSNYKEGLAYKTVVIKGRKVTHTFDSLPAGIYAVAVIHDENSNKKIDSGLFGMPKEGYGVSNNIRPKLRAPKFSEAQFLLQNDTQKSITINLKYPD